MKKVDKVWAYFALEEEGEGLCAFLDQKQKIWIPLICATETVAKRFEDMAQNIANESGTKIQLAEFTVRTDIKIIEPEQ